jgi:hypothetical protein
MFITCYVLVQMLAASFGIVSSARLSRARPKFVDTFDCPATLATALKQRLAALRGVKWDDCNLLLLVVCQDLVSIVGFEAFVVSMIIMTMMMSTSFASL